MIPALCIDNKNKPEEIPDSQWIQEGFKYHIIHVYYYPHQGLQGVELLEVKLKTPPFKSYKLSRFAFTEEGIKQLIEMMKACSELNEIEITELLQEELTLKN